MITLTDELIKKYDQKRKYNIPEIEHNSAYVNGLNPATLTAPPQKKPDNRIPIPLAKIAVNTLQGYAGRAGDIQLQYETIKVEDNYQAETDVYINAQREIAEHNDEALETSELYKEALTQGFAYELLWVSDNLKLPGVMTPEYKKVSPDEIVIIWSRDLKPIKEAVLRFQSYDDGDVLDVYFPLRSERWEKPKGKYNWIRNKEGDTIYPYKSPPLIVYSINEQQQSLFQAEKGLIDANDKILNKTVNEVDRFNALIALFPGKITKEVRDKLTEIGVIDDLDGFDRWPEYLQKDLSGVNDLYSGAAKWIKDLFFQSVSVPDFSDKEFLNAASGIAMAYKLLGLEFLASSVETYFNKGLKERFKLINDVLGESIQYNVDNYKLTIKSKRNLPVDDLAKVQIATMLIGLVSKETLLKFLPRDIVDDAGKEMERIKAEQESIPEPPPLSIGE